MTVQEALDHARSQLQQVQSPRLEAERLLARMLGTTPSMLVTQEAKQLSMDQMHWLEQALRRRAQHEPLAYILQSQGFYKHDFFVTHGVLIPRPETELIVDAALMAFAAQKPAQFADLGCGSGCIGLSLLCEWPTSHLTAIDASMVAIEVSRRNALRLQVTPNHEFICADVDQVDRTARFDLIVANPPYISVHDARIDQAVKKFEPAEALFAEDDGLAAIEKWSAWAYAALQSDGLWLCEIGAGQSEAVEARLRRIGYRELRFLPDLAGHLRVVSARKV